MRGFQLVGYMFLASHQRPKRLRALVALLLTCVLALTSCSDKQESPAADKETGIHKNFERGPVAVAIDIDKKEISIADQLNLTISVTAEEDYEVQLPRFGDKLEQFGIVDYQTSQPELIADNKLRTKRSYVLEPFLSGEYTIPPMKIVFKEKDIEDVKEHELETEEIKINVTSLLPEKVADLKIHEIRPPVELPHPKRGWIWAVSILSVVVITSVVSLLIWLRNRRQTEEIAVSILAHELAYDQLEALIAEDLIAKGEVKLFFSKVSDILRHYIENRFGLHAPEQTTEEFMEEVKTSDYLSANYRPLLQKFLRYCDLVKFAEHQPAREDIQNTFDSCKAFIEQTQEETSST
jgi:hypothetical protein